MAPQRSRVVCFFDMTALTTFQAIATEILRERDSATGPVTMHVVGDIRRQTREGEMTWLLNAPCCRGRHRRPRGCRPVRSPRCWTGSKRNPSSCHSIMVVRHGHVVAEGWWAPYSAERPHLLYSLTKSFTSIAVGLAIADGLLSLDDRVVDVLPDHVPADVSEQGRRITVHHLLSMTAGHAHGQPRPRPGSWNRATW